jgi:hypothetical protein
MKPEEFILWLKGYLDGLENNLPQGKGLEVITLSPGLLTIKQKLSQVGNKIIDFNSPPPTKNPYIGPSKNPYEIYCSEPDKVPYSSICSCNTSNGGSGICGCIMGNTMVHNPKKFDRTTNSSNTSYTPGINSTTVTYDFAKEKTILKG